MNKTVEEALETIDKMLAIPKAQMYWTAQREFEREKELNEIRDLFDDKYYRIEEITKIKDFMFIVEYENKSFKEKHFMPIVKGENPHEYFPDFNSALLGAVSIEQTGETRAGYWAAKLMGKED